jgi:hypothetical protein
MPRGITLHAEVTVVQGEDNIVSDMDGEKVMLSVRNGKYYNLGELGGEIWDLIAEPVPVRRVVESLLERYDVAPSVCEAQVLAFLTELMEERLIEAERSA